MSRRRYSRSNEDLYEALDDEKEYCFNLDNVTKFVRSNNVPAGERGFFFGRSPACWLLAVN